MAASSRRTVITGLGVLSPLGLDADTFWRALADGKSGVRAITSFDAGGAPVHIAGEVDGFDAKKYLAKGEPRKALRMMSRPIQLAVAAAQAALDHGRVEKSKLDPTRFGVEFGCGLLASELPELADASRVSVNGRGLDLARWGKQGIEQIQPLWMLKYLPNMPACHVSILHGAEGPNNSITESDAAGLLALGEAYRILQRDAADFFLVGGTESKMNPLSLVRQCLFEPLSRRNDAPERACRPFDRDRDGIVLGEGAAVLVVEDLEHARRRGATIYAEVVGFGAAFDRRHDGGGIARAARAALAEAGVSPQDVDHVNAHGLSSKESDAREARGLQEVFGASGTPVFAPKSYMGNLGAAGGLAELAASVLALVHGTVPRTLNFETPDPACPVPVAAQPRAVTRPFVVKVGFTQAGQCGAVVVRKWDAV